MRPVDVAEQDGMEIPMGEVDARILAKVVEYCKFHHHQETNQTSTEEVDRWEKNFVQVDKSTLFQLILVGFILSTLGAHILTTRLVCLSSLAGCQLS